MITKVLVLFFMLISLISSQQDLIINGDFNLHGCPNPQKSCKVDQQSLNNFVQGWIPDPSFTISNDQHSQIQSEDKKVISIESGCIKQTIDRVTKGVYETQIKWKVDPSFPLENQQLKLYFNGRYLETITTDHLHSQVEKIKFEVQWSDVQCEFKICSGEKNSKIVIVNVKLYKISELEEDLRSQTQNLRAQISLNGELRQKTFIKQKQINKYKPECYRIFKQNTRVFEDQL